MHNRSIACCFSGYRPEKYSRNPLRDVGFLADVRTRLEQSVAQAAQAGYTLFLTGMGRGFDLWAAEAVLAQRQAKGLKLICALPFEKQADNWNPHWRNLHTRVLLAADQVFTLSEEYTPSCFHERNRFLVDGASRLICWWDGASGGTRYTLQYAQRQGLEIVNLADGQLSMF